MGSALHRDIAGADAIWGLTDHLLAAVLDALNSGNWQRGGGKGPRPKPTPRPGRGGRKSTRMGGNTTMSLAEARAWLDRRRDGR